jgi:hypothetical protein
MKEPTQEEVPDVLAGQTGTSEREEFRYGHSTHASSISQDIHGDNTHYPDPVVETIRILARRGWQLREAEEAAERQAEDADSGVYASPTASISIAISDREVWVGAMGEAHHTASLVVRADCGFSTDTENVGEADHG